MDVAARFFIPIICALGLAGCAAPPRAPTPLPAPITAPDMADAQTAMNELRTYADAVDPVDAERAAELRRLIERLEGCVTAAIEWMREAGVWMADANAELQARQERINQLTVELETERERAEFFALTRRMINWAVIAAMAACGGIAVFALWKLRLDLVLACLAGIAVAVGVGWALGWALDHARLIFFALAGLAVLWVAVERFGLGLSIKQAITAGYQRATNKS